MNIYSSRINGYALLSLFIGVFIGDKWGIDIAAVILVPVLLLWLFTHDEITYQKRSDELREQHE